jgi:tetratricopeptide (TPR) repeat protein
MDRFWRRDEERDDQWFDGEKAELEKHGGLSQAKAHYQKLLRRAFWRRDVPAHDLYDAHLKLGAIDVFQGKTPMSAVAFARALAFAERQFGAVSSEVAIALGRLASFHRQRGPASAQLEQLFNDVFAVPRGYRVTVQSLYWGYKRHQGAVEILLRDREQPGPAGVVSLRPHGREPEPRSGLRGLGLGLPEQTSYPDAVAVLYLRARFARYDDSTGEAEQLCRRAHEQSRKLLGQTHLHTKRLQTTLIAYRAYGRCVLAYDTKDGSREASVAERAIADLKRSGEQIEAIDLADLVAALATAGLYYARHRRYDEAQPYFETVVTRVERNYDPRESYELVYSGDDLPAALCNLAQCAFFQGRYDLAESCDLRALALREQLFGETPPTGYVLEHLAQIYEKQGGKPDRINELEARVDRIRAAVGPDRYAGDRDHGYRF